MNLAFRPSSSGGGGREPALHLVVPDAGRCSAAAAAGLSEFLAPSAAAAAAAAAAAGRPNKRKRRPAGTPDPDAEVVALSPKTLMESDRYVCEICNQGFQRDQNLQMHRRRHKVPWKLLKRPHLATTKRVYICPERSCLHHDPAHALGDLVGIKKHYRRKHCTEKQWKCDKCSKGYAVQSDYKAHLKTCGTRGHCCDCGRVFSSETQEHAIWGRKRNSPPHPVTDTRASNESPSQSSDTTQAMSFTQSGMSDTAGRSTVDIPNSTTKVLLDEHARRIQAVESQAATPSSAMPAWLTDLRRNKLEPLQRVVVPADHGHFGDHVVTKAEVRPGRGDRQVAHLHGSRSRVTRCSSNSPPFPGSEAISCSSEMKMILEPSLQLSIGPASGEDVLASSSLSPYNTDIKPSLRASAVLDREAMVLTNCRMDHPKHSLARVEKSSDRPTTVGTLSALAAHLLPASVRQQSGSNKRIWEGAGTDQTVSLSGFLTALSPVDSSSAGLALSQSTKSKHENKSRTEMVSYYIPACGGGSASMYRENWAGNVHASDPALGAARGSTRRGIRDASQLEPATSSVMTNRQALHLDVAEGEHLVGASTKSVSNELACRSQKQMAAAARDQNQADMNNAARSDLVTRILSRTTDEARQECEEAQRELARAELLKREAREQLQLAAAEKAYAERARDAAKRQVEISEAELEKAKRLRAHAQAELQKAGASQGFSSSSKYCHACKSAIESTPTHTPTTTTPPRSRRSTSTSPTASWSMMAPSLGSTDQLDAGTRHGSGGGQICMNPGNRISWSESTVTGFDHFGTIRHAHHGSYNMRSGMAIGKSPPSGGDPNTVTAVQVSSPEQSDHRDLTARTPDLDLNGIS